MRLIKEQAYGRWIALGGGGYDMLNVARGWALAWAIICGQEDSLPQDLPREFVEHHQVPKDRRRLIDEEQQLRGRFWHRARRDADEIIAFIKKHHFPILGA